MAVFRRERARSVRSSSYEVMRARSTAMVLCTAASCKRWATPLRVAVEAMFLPIAGRLDWLLVLCTCPQRAARVRLRWVRRLRRARVARIVAGETEAGGSMPPRSNRAICAASIVSFVACPPGMACLERA